MTIFFTVNNSSNIKFIVPQGVLEYAAGLQQGEFWEVRGTKAHNLNKQNDFLKKREEELKIKINQPDSRKKLDDFLKESFLLMNAIIDNQKQSVKEYLDKRFIFVIGPPRTGGTFLFSQMADAVDFPWKKLLHKMIHDSVPNGNLMRDNEYEEINTLGWREPRKYLNLTFQISQLLVYLKREVNSQTMIIKNMALCYCLKILDRLFGERAQYIVSIRHPAAMSASRAPSYHSNNDEAFKMANFSIWYTLYQEIVRDGLPKGDIIPLLFGNEMDSYLEDFFHSTSSNKSPEKLSISQRNYDETFWQKKEIQDKMVYLRKLWELKGLTFPVINEIK